MTPHKIPQELYIPRPEEDRHDWRVAFAVLALIAFCTIGPELLANWLFPG